MARRKNKAAALVADMPSTAGTPEQRAALAQEESREKAYGRAFAKAEKDEAVKQGAADGAAAAINGTDPALARARARALGVDAAPAPVSAPVERNTRFIQTQDGQRLPEAFYDLKPEQQREFKRLVSEGEQRETSRNEFDQTALGLLDLQERMAQRITKLEARDAEKDQLIAALATALEQQNTAIELSRSKELADQLSSLSDAVINATAVETSLRTQTANSQREGQIQADLDVQRKAELTVLVDNAKASTKSNTELLQGLTNGVKNDLASAQGDIQKLQVQAQGLQGSIDVLQNPITRQEVASQIESTVQVEVKKQLPDAVDMQLQEDKAAGLYKPGNAGFLYDRKAVMQRNDDAKRRQIEMYGDALDRKRIGGKG